MLKTKAETKNGLFPEHLKGIFMDSKKPMTTAAGASIVDYFNFQAAGPRCPALSQDVWLIEKLAHFGREVTPKQRMHAKRAGAFGAVRELP